MPGMFRSPNLASFLVLAVVIVAATALTVVSGVILPLAIQTYLFYMILVLGLQLFTGNSGVFSFGHVAFTAVGAYTAAILTVPVDQKVLRLREMPETLLNLQADPIVAVIVAAGVAALIAFVVGVPITRLTGLAASMATFALLIIVHVVAINLVPVTNGRSGITGIPVQLGVPGVLAWTLVALGIVVVFKGSTLALRLRASREDEIAARALGIAIFPERLTAWVASAAVFGSGGAIYAIFITTFSPDAFYLSLTFTVVAMLVIGGVGSVTGAVVGTLFVAFINEFLRVVQSGPTIGPIDLPSISGLQSFGVALLTLLVLVLRPQGLAGGRELLDVVHAWRRPDPVDTATPD